MHGRSCVDIPANIVDIQLLVLGEQEEHQGTFSCRLCLWVVSVDAGNVGSFIDFVPCICGRNIYLICEWVTPITSFQLLFAPNDRGSSVHGLGLIQDVVSKGRADFLLKGSVMSL